MTTFVLHGGNASKLSQKNDQFFAAFTAQSVKPVVKILMVYWARPANEWTRIFARDQKLIEVQAAKINKTAILEIVTSPTELFAKLPTADVMFVAGGDSTPIEILLPQLTNLGQALTGKIYLGSSMGAFIVAKNYVLSFDDQDDHTVHSGLGLVPINLLCHWDLEPNQTEKLKLLKKTDSSLPIITLAETESVTHHV